MDSTTIEIPSELFAPAESSSYSGVFDLPELVAGPDVYAFAEPLAWNVIVSNTGDALLVSGTVTGLATTACARCLDPIEVDFQGDIEGYFLIGEAETPEDMDEDEFERLDDSNTIDLVPLMKAALLVDTPLVPLCRDDCKGICPDCGANLNEGDCGCASKREAERLAEAEAANPFAALKNLTFDE